MAKAPRSKTGARQPNDAPAALTLLDAAFCVDPRQRGELVRQALAADASLRRWAEHWASTKDEPSPSNVDAQVADSLGEFLASLASVDSREGGGKIALPFSAAWRARLAAAARRLAADDAYDGRFDDALAVAKLDALKEFAYGAGHEINNPLANISVRAQTLLRDETNGERRRMLATINRQAMRAHEMIADLMLFARPPELDRRETDAAAIVRRVVDELAATAAAQATRLECAIDDAPLVASVDATQLAVATKAIVRNALEAVAAGGNVTVDARFVTASDVAREAAALENASPQRFHRRVGANPNGDVSSANSSSDTERSPTPWLEITVADDGPGFTRREQAHLFDPFFCGREAGRGLGFGLCVAWRIATDHGGQIAVMSEPNRGATVILAVPAS
jgi:hypothetical protein